jgi:O-antigen biosynthesis protein WbqV
MGMRAAKLGVDVAIAIAAFVLAFELAALPGKPVFFEDPRAHLVLAWGALYAGLTLLALIGFQMQRNTWRFVSVPDVGAIIRVAAITSVAFLVIVFISNRAYELPRTTFVLTGLFQVMGMALVRLMSRAVHERSVMAFFLPGMVAPRPPQSQGMMVVGEPKRIDAFLREVHQTPYGGFYPIAALTPMPEWLGQRIRNVDVVGLSNELEDLVDRPFRGEPIKAVTLLEEPAEIGLTAEKFSRISARGIKIMRAAAPGDVDFGGKGDSLEEIKLDHFLARAPVRLHDAPVRDLIAGKRVFITGAGGSIGSEICRQAAAFGAAHLTMVDNSEFLIYQIDKEMRLQNPHLSIREVMCDVRDRGRIDQWIAEEKPDIVFHAAALKHVPLVENHPAQGVLTNIVGTRNVAEACRNHNVQTMVLISTDKAVGPTNVMGATKRLAEMLVRGLDQDQPTVQDANAPRATRYVTVRFGNVLGSNGSVVPLFREQIERGGPVTVTHPDVERFFMTIPEAVQLVFHATTLGARRPIGAAGSYVLEMGKPVRIMDLARQLIESYGKRPGADIPIEIVGLRPGEKLTEELVDQDEKAEASALAGIQEVRSAGSILPLARVEELERLAHGGDDSAVRRMVSQLIAGRLRPAAA